MAKAFALNELTARWATEQALKRDGTHNPGALPPFRDDPESRMLFRNDSGETIPAHGIVRVTGYVEANGRHMVTVAKPATTIGWFIVNSREPVAANEFGYGFSGPMVRVVYDSGDTPTNGQVYGVDGFKARSYTSGKPVVNVVMLGILDSTNKIAVARIEHASNLMIKAPSGGIPGRVGTLVQGATCEIFTLGNTTNQLAASGVSITVYNWSTSSVCATGDRYGIAGLVNGKWHIIAEDCKDTGSTIQGASSSGSVTQPSDPLQLGSPPVLQSDGSLTTVQWYGAGVGGGYG